MTFIGRLFSKKEKEDIDGLKSYNGSYHNGNAVYRYREENGERVIEGAFSFVEKYKKHPGGRCVDTARGNFTHNIKEGAWTFSHSEGTESASLEIQYQKGVGNGPYRLSVRKTPFDSKEEVVELSLTLRNGHATGNISGFFGGGKFSGSCDDQGYAHGVWRFDGDNRKDLDSICIEEWEHGVLKDAYLYNEAKDKRQPVKEILINLFQCTVEYEGVTLEHMIRRGSRSWHGDILTK